MGYNLQFIGIAIGFPGNIHDSVVLRDTALYQRANNSEILLESKVNVNGQPMAPMLVEIR